MKRFWARRWFKATAAACVIVAMLLGFACWFLRIRGMEDVLALMNMSSERWPPVWKDLALRRIGPGDAVEDVIARTRPYRVGRFGRWTRVSYFSEPDLCGLVIIARDGRLIAASPASDTWRHVFFDVTTPQDDEDWQAAYREYRQRTRQAAETRDANAP